MPNLVRRSILNRVVSIVNGSKPPKLKVCISNPPSSGVPDEEVADGYSYVDGGVSNDPYVYRGGSGKSLRG